MSAFKKFTKSDVFVVPYLANKEWNFNYSASYPPFNDNVKIYKGTNLTGSFNINGSSNQDGTLEKIVYDEMNHLFYQKYTTNLNTHSLASSQYYLSASIYRPTSSYFNYDENPYIIKNFPTGANETIHVISINPNVYGNKIKPGSFRFLYNGGNFGILDDENGNIFIGEGPGPNYSFLNYAGNIFYSHGIAIITNQNYSNIFVSGSTDNYNFSFKNEHVIYEQVIKCTVKEHEMNCSYNPSLKQYLTSESSSIHDFATGSLFQPYITTIGLYNDKTELLAVAKLAKPIPVSRYIDTNFIVKLDV